MFRIPKSVLSGGAVIAVVLLALAVPRAARAVVATLVQVVNTAANPAITQDTSRQASQIVSLVCRPATSFPDSLACIQLDGHGKYGPTQPYAVPPTDNLVVTSLDYYPNSASSSPGYLSIVDQTNTNPTDNPLEIVGVADFSLPFTVQFSSGIVIAGTARPTIVTTSNSANQFVYLHGYITTN